MFSNYQSQLGWTDPQSGCGNFGYPEEYNNTVSALLERLERRRCCWIMNVEVKVVLEDFGSPLIGQKKTILSRSSYK